MKTTLGPEETQDITDFKKEINQMKKAKFRHDLQQ